MGTLMHGQMANERAIREGRIFGVWLRAIDHEFRVVCVAVNMDFLVCQRVIGGIGAGQIVILTSEIVAIETFGRIGDAT
jgi:hypothetical protein